MNETATGMPAQAVAARVGELADELAGLLWLWAGDDPDAATIIRNLANDAERIGDDAGWLARQAGTPGLSAASVAEYRDRFGVDR